MNIKGQHLAYFSATHSTRDLVRRIGRGIHLPIIKEHRLAEKAKSKPYEVVVASSEVLVFGVPSYFGRVPALVIPYIQQFKGDNSPAIIVCTYGNRDFDDTLLELRNMLMEQGFIVIAAGGFVATHSIYSEVASDRPDSLDLADQRSFADQCRSILLDVDTVKNFPLLQVKGNYPYRPLGKILFYPTADERCDQCGTCSLLCPVGAISRDTLRQTDADKCIVCGRCITVCHVHARAHRSKAFEDSKKVFLPKFETRKGNISFF